MAAFVADLPARLGAGSSEVIDAVRPVGAPGGH